MSKKAKKTQREKIFNKHYQTKNVARVAALWSYDKDVARDVQDIALDLSLKVDDADEYDYVLEHLAEAVLWVAGTIEERKKHKDARTDLPQAVQF